MTNVMHKLKITCLSLLGITAFYFSFVFWDYLFGSWVDQFYLVLPRPLFSLVTLFLIFFLCRISGTLIFMPKPKLKEILYDGNPDPSLSQIVLKAFSTPFLKRVFFFLLAVVLEMLFRMQAILVFLWNTDNPLWEAFAEVSVGTLVFGWAVAAFLIMELPWFFMFYVLSVPGHPNRLKEYKFGTKLFIFVLLVYIVMRVLGAALPGGTLAYEALQSVLLVLISFGIWLVMYRPSAIHCGCSSCPLKAAFKKLTGKKEAAVPAETKAKEEVKAE